MMLMSTWQIFAAGSLGPFIPELIKLFNAKDKARMWQRYKRWEYWALFVCILPVAGLSASGYGLQQMPLHLALHLGAAPALLLGVVASARSGQRKGLFAQPPQRPSPMDLLSWI